MFLKDFQLFFDDDGGGGGGVTSLPEVPSPSSADLDVLAGDEDGEDEAPDESDSEGAEEGEDEELEKERPGRTEKDEEEPDVEEEDEEDKPAKAEKEDEDKETAPEDLASIKAIKKDYPDIFKKHPQLRVAIAEHRQFRNMFTSLDEAKESIQAAENLFQLREQIVDKADFGFLLDEIHKADSASASRLVKGILPAILERSKDLYYEVTNEPISQFVHAAYSRAVKENNPNLKHSAMYLWRFLGKEGNPGPVQTGPSEADRQFESRVQEFEQRKFTDASSTVNRDIQTGLTGLIERAIDPKGSLKETTKKALVSELVREIDREVASDPNHMTRVNRLWANAKRSSYAQGHTSRIISAYLERAKQLLPKHARKVRDELGLSHDAKEETKPPTVVRKENAPAVRAAPNGKPPAPRTIRDTNPRKIDWARTSDEDILAGKARLRR